MPRPDATRLQRHVRTIGDSNGETATLRAYVSGVSGTPRYGVGDTQAYMAHTITGLFGFANAPESLQAGGLTVANQLYVSTETAIGPRDELDWRGTAYRVDGAPVPMNLGGRLGWRSPLRLMAVTA